MIVAFKVLFEFDVLWVSLVGVLAILTGIFFYRLLADAISRKRWRILLALRISAISILLILLFKPAIEFAIVPQKHSDLIILIDNSRSMEFADVGGMSRIDYAKKMILENEDIISNNSNIRIFAFSDKLKSLSFEQAERISAEGGFTDISAAFRELASQVNREDIQAIIVFTDGQHLGASSPKGLVASFNRPIYWLGLGSENPSGIANNLSVNLINPPVKIAADSENYLTVEISKTGTLAISGTIETILNESDKIFSKRVFNFSDKQSKRSIDIPIRPELIGKVVLQFRVFSQADEYILSDNVRFWHCISLPEKIRILLIESQISPEYKFLKQYLQSDSAVEFVSMIQIRPGKFLVTKQMAGFIGNELPKSQDEFDKFDLFILGNISHRTLNEHQSALLRHAVEQGRGVVFIAGDKISDLRKSNISELLPIKITQKAEWISQRFVPHITLAGKADDILKNCVDFFNPMNRYYNSVKLDGTFRAGPALPVSRVLMEFNEKGKHIPVLTIKPYGKGKSALLLASGFWRWALNPDVNLREKLYRVFWGQLIRNISGKELKGKQKPAILVNLSTNAVRTGETLTVSCYVFDESATAITSKPVICELIKGEKILKAIKLTRRDNHFIGEISVNEPGEYRVRVKTLYATAELVDENVLKAYKVDKEFLQVTLNRKLLNELASVSGTERMQSADSFGEILNRLTNQYAQQLAHQSEIQQVRLFDYRIFFMLIFVLIITSEWLLRYKWGLR